MPATMIKSFATKASKSEGEVERLYNKAKELVKKEYTNVKVDSDSYYQLVVGILKKMLSITEEEGTAPSVSISLASSGMNAGGSGSFPQQMFKLSKEEREKEEKKRKKVLDYLKTINK